MQEEKEKQILNLKDLGPDFLDILPLDIFISNQELPHIDEVGNQESPYRKEILNQELPHIDENNVDSTTLSNQEQQSKQLKKKRKRSPKIGEKPHTKDAPDNILRKIQVHYLSFVVSFTNALLKHLGYSSKSEFVDLLKTLLVALKTKIVFIYLLE